MRKLLKTFVLLFLSFGYAIAQTTPPNPGGPEDNFSGPGSPATSIDMYIVTMIVVAMVFGAGYFLKNTLKLNQKSI